MMTIAWFIWGKKKNEDEFVFLLITIACIIGDCVIVNFIFH